jgi:hypothetical protein
MSAYGRFCCRSRRSGERGIAASFLKPSIAPALFGGGGIGSDTRNAYAAQAAAIGGGRTISLASRRRFCAMAASVNSSCAPRGPRNRRRPSFRMRFKCANSISTRFRSRRDCSNASVLANARATSRASFLPRQRGQLRCTPRRHVRIPGERCHCRGSVHCGHARTLNDQGSCALCQACKTSDRRSSPAPRGTATARIAAQRHNR